MSGRWSVRRVAPPSQGRTNPFGATSPVSDPHHTTTMADAVRRCRWIAIDINASGFLLLFLGPPEEKRRLIHGFDADFPTQSAVSRLIATRLAEEVVRRVSVSTVPLWWSSRPATASYECFVALEWCEGPVAGLHEVSGIVFPVYAERGQSGVVIFTGDDMAIDNGMLFETHARSFALFAAVTRLRPADGGNIPVVSKRELECLSLTANGLTSEEIAAELGLSVHTANQYLTNTAQKLNAVNRMHAVAKALRLGLIE
jgi:DNA-binding CsgD family transcriptional regulator